jgi:hypothetical protein
MNRSHRGGISREKHTAIEQRLLATYQARGTDAMTHKTYLIRFKPPQIGTQVVVAESVQIHDEHLAFLNSKGELVALFLLELVEGWSQVSE